jgi:hypothetical protein
MDPLPIQCHDSLPTSTEAVSLGTSSQRCPQDAAVLRFAEVNPVVLEIRDLLTVSVTAQASGLPHFRSQGFPQTLPLPNSTAGSRCIPMTVVKTVCINPSQDQIAFLTREIRNVVVVAIDQKLS